MCWWHIHFQVLDTGHIVSTLKNSRKIITYVSDDDRRERSVRKYRFERDIVEKNLLTYI